MAEKKMPADYKCSKCGVTGIKLWCNYKSLNSELLCVDHAEEDIRKVTKRQEGEPIYWESSFSNGESNQIGWYFPAVPNKKGQYWGDYAFSSKADEAWWKSLPTRLTPFTPGDRKERALMIIIQKIVGRHEQGLIALDESSFKFFELAKRIRYAHDEAALHAALKSLADFNK